MTVLRRLDAVLEPTKQEPIPEYAHLSLRGLRAHCARAVDGPAREDEMSRLPPRRRIRRSPADRPTSGEGRGVLVLAQEARALYMPARTQAITDGGSSIVEYERSIETGDPAILAELAEYNRIDCDSTRPYFETG